MCNYVYMSVNDVVEVIPVAQARADLSATLHRFRGNPDAVPVIIGSHRKPEAVLVPIGQFRDDRARSVTLARLRAIAPLIRRLAGAAHFGDVRVFGSVARGDQTPGSDVDLLVSPSPGATLFDLAQFEMDMELLVGTRVSAVPTTALDHERDARILNEAIAL